MPAFVGSGSGSVAVCGMGGGPDGESEWYEDRLLERYEGDLPNAETAPKAGSVEVMAGWPRMFSADGCELYLFCRLFRMTKKSAMTAMSTATPTPTPTPIPIFAPLDMPPDD